MQEHIGPAGGSLLQLKTGSSLSQLFAEIFVYFSRTEGSLL